MGGTRGNPKDKTQQGVSRLFKPRIGIPKQTAETQRRQDETVRELQLAIAQQRK